MSFDRPWILFLLALPVAWLAYEWVRTARRAGLLAMALCFAAVVLALAEPRLMVPESRMAVAVLVDTSASTSPEDLQRANEIVGALQRARGRHWFKVIPFARGVRPLSPAETDAVPRLLATSGEAGRATDLEAAIREAVAALPAGLIPRVVLISDGKENQGSVVRAAWQARELGIPIDTFALAGRARPALRLESVRLPAVAFTGERFPIDITLSAPGATPAEVELSAEGRSLGKSSVLLTAGENSLRLHASLNTPGALELTAVIRPAGSPELRFSQAVTLRRPTALFLSGDPPEDDSHLLSVLSGAHFEVKAVAGLSGVRLAGYQLVILNNWDLESLPEGIKNDLEEYVRRGGGLLVIGGERNVYTEEKAAEDALERALPARLAPPRTPEGTALILIVDKSSSMEGRKMEIARLAAIGAVNNLKPADQVGVLAFDNTFEWALPIRKAENKEFINRIIAGIRPDGGTQIAPALQEAFTNMRRVQAASRHIVLLTDGISEEGNSFATASSAKNERITISTVGIGQDVNKAYLERVAQLAGGKSYFVLDLSQLEQILVKDVLEHTGTTAVERPLAPEVVKRAEILNEVGMETAPLLKGYVRFIAKPAADTILKIDREDPLLARWQYGLGRSAVFASDAKSRWAADWIAWKGFDRFWTNVARDLLPHAQQGEATLDYDGANGALVARYRLGPGVEEPATLPRLFAFGPGGFQRQVALRKIAVGTYEGSVKIGARQGLFRVLPAAESALFPEVGLYRPEAELHDYGANEALLRQVAAYTGGSFDPPPAAVFAGQGKTIETTLTLWPGLLGLAIVLSLAELVMRKWRGILGARVSQ
jgi:Mg-chelatase subunit ChlD